MPNCPTLPAAEIAGEPMHEVRVEVGVADGVDEERGLHGIESLRNVNRDCSSAKRRFGRIESVGDFRSSGKESSGG